MFDILPGLSDITDEAIDTIDAKISEQIAILDMDITDIEEVSEFVGEKISDAIDQFDVLDMDIIGVDEISEIIDEEISEMDEMLDEFDEFVSEVFSPVTDSVESSLDDKSLGDLTEDDLEIVYGGLDSYDFNGIDCLEDTDRLDSTLENFTTENWETLSLDEKKEYMQDLADYICEVTGNENPPQIEFYNNPVEGDFGGYVGETNTLSVNEYMLYENAEAADTVTHELWHAYQYQRAMNPSTKLDYMYLENFQNYISPDVDFEAYQSQLLEGEARAFAQNIKDRLNSY